MDDLISRRAAIEQLERREKLMVGDKRVGVEHVKVFLQNRPTIDAEPVRHGRWDANGRCTNCGGHAPYWAMASTYHKSPYCFECGAKMDLEVQDEG